MNELAQTILTNLGRTTLYLAAAALLVQFLLWAARAKSPRVHHVAWLLVLLQGWFFASLTIHVAVVGSEPPLASSHKASSGLADDMSDARAGSQWQAALANVPPRLLTSPRNWETIATIAWLLGVSIGVGYFVFGYVSFVRTLPPGSAPTESWRREWEEVLSAGGVNRRIPMRVTHDVGPLLCRLPTGYELLVPHARWVELPSAERIAILQHELAHYRRGDVWRFLAVRLLALPHWFNPLAWLAVRQFDRTCEWACDQDATRAGSQQRLTFAKALLKLGERPSVRPSLHPAACGHPLSQRIRRLLLPALPEDRVVKRAVLIALTLGLTVCGLIRFETVARDSKDMPHARADVSVAEPAVVTTRAELSPASVPAVMRPALPAANNALAIASEREQELPDTIPNPPAKKHTTTVRPRCSGCTGSKTR